MSDNVIPVERIERAIYLIRGQKVMLDRDLAVLYGVETRALKQAVKRNEARLPSDFMFVLSEEELSKWRSHFATSNSNRTGLRHAPMAFTDLNANPTFFAQRPLRTQRSCFYVHDVSDQRSSWTSF